MAPVDKQSKSGRKKSGFNLFRAIREDYTKIKTSFKRKFSNMKELEASLLEEEKKLKNQRGVKWTQAEAEALGVKHPTYKFVLENKFNDLMQNMSSSTRLLKEDTDEEPGLNRKQMWKLFKGKFESIKNKSMFDKLFDLMDTDGSGVVNEQEFTVTMCFLLHKGSAKDKVELAFKFFDTNHKNYIDKDEFSDLIAAVMGPQLSTLLSIPGGRESFKKFLEYELADENLRFYEKIESLNKEYYHVGVPMTVALNVMFDYIVQNSSSDTINISGKVRENLISEVNKAKERGWDGIDVKIFDPAVREIVDMLEAGCIPHFKSALRSHEHERFTDLAWEYAGLDDDENMTLEIFRDFCSSVPELFDFLDVLKSEVEGELIDLDEIAKHSRNKKKDV